MRKLVLLAVLAIVTSTLTEKEAHTEFKKFIKKYNKHYSSLKEYIKRFHIFQETLKRLENKKYEWQGVSKFADIIATDLGERTTKTEEEIEQVIRSTIDQTYQKNINAIRAAYSAYNADKTRLIKINTDVLKEMLRTYIKAQNLPASHIKHLMEL